MLKKTTALERLQNVISNWKLWYEWCNDTVSNTNWFCLYGKALLQFAHKHTFRCRSSSSLICSTHSGLSHNFQKKGHHSHTEFLKNSTKWTGQNNNNVNNNMCPAHYQSNWMNTWPEMQWVLLNAKQDIQVKKNLQQIAKMTSRKRPMHQSFTSK